jgi:hypothetical protein
MSIDCPKCKNKKTNVFDSGPKDNGVFRRRSCRKCGYHFFTMERIVNSVRAILPPEPKMPPRRPAKRLIRAKPRKPTSDALLNIDAIPTSTSMPDFERMSDSELDSWIHNDNSDDDDFYS